VKEYNERVAILSMSGRFPEVDGIEGLRRTSLAGQSLIRRFACDEMVSDGVRQQDIDASNYVPVKGWLAGTDLFDASAFGISPAEAVAMDPQQRIFLEQCALALDGAAIDPMRFSGRIGIFAGQFISTYLLRQLAPAMAASSDPIALATVFQGNTVDQLAARVAYRLDLRGPAITIQTACSTSLVAVHMACNSLLTGECDLAIAGGVALSFPARSGYFHVEGGIHSRLGSCRPFDAAADGTVFGDGVGVVVLGRADEAIGAGYPVRGVIVATAVNNDGARKAGYTAPSVDGQKSVLAEALEMASASPDTIGYLETHGTGTQIGDLIEMTAIKSAYLRSRERAPLAIGAVKANIGHLEAAAGVAGLIRAVDVVESGVIPPIAGLRQVNRLLETERFPVVFPTSSMAWPDSRTPRRAAVSAFGVGGTNAHVIVEQSPTPAERAGRSDVARLLPISGATRTAARMNADAIAATIQATEQAPLAEIQKTLALGRPEQAFRTAIVLGRQDDPSAVFTNLSVQHAAAPPRVVLIAPGQGSLVAGAAQALYSSDANFRRCLDATANILLDRSHIDVRALLFDTDADRLRDTERAHPAGFVLSYALASWLDTLKVPVTCTVGHSLGEFVAAVRAGILSLEDAIDLVVARGKLIRTLLGGGMLAAMLSPTKLASAIDLAGYGLDVACYNGPEQTVLAGPCEAIAAARKQLHDLQVPSAELSVNHAFHSRMMAPAEGPWCGLLNKIHFAPPRLPYFSSVSGRSAEDDTVSTSSYWVEHLLGPVRFEGAVRAAAGAGQPVALVELGTESGLARNAQRWLRSAGTEAHAVALLGNSRREARDRQALTALGQLWCLGAPMNWDRLVDAAARRITLPPRRLEPTRHFMDAASPPNAGGTNAATSASELKQPDYRSIEIGEGRVSERQRRWLVVAPSEDSVTELAEHLLDRGQIVTMVVPGPDKKRLRRGFYQMPVRDAEAWLELLRELKSLVRTPNLIVYALGLDPNLAIEDGVVSLGAVADAWVRESTTDSMLLGVVAGPARPVLGNECLHPNAAGLAAAACVLEQEVPRLRTCFVDLPDGGAIARIDRHSAGLVTEILLDGAIDAVSIRGRRLFRQEFEPVRLPSDQSSSYRVGGLYLVIGGAGGLGRLIADDLVHRLNARVIVVSRTAAGKSTAGGGVIAMDADVTSVMDLESVLLRIRQDHAHINGIIHAAGVSDDRSIAMTDAHQCAGVLAPKFGGLVNIATCIERLGPWPDLDFVVSFSSTATIIGGPGQGAYAAANAAMDASSLNFGRDGPLRWVTVLWDTVRGTGMAAAATADRLSPLAAARGAYAIDPSQCAALLERALGSKAPAVVISRVAAADLPSAHRRIKEVLDAEVVRVGRPDLATEYSPPRNELEERLADVWGRTLGVERIGIHDRFVDLGGHSLLAAQLRGQIKTVFDVELPVSTIFTAGTVAAMAAMLETAIMAELQPNEES
jgi:acyl transferase domain-containing protein/NADP-dependent 3-hydroxy acid dehydrogenase YdfG/acyl carrier protein